jgi:hypothetical protein
MHKRPVIGGWASVRMSLGRRLVWELQLFAPFRRFRSQKRLQRSLIPLNFVRPVTPKVAGSSPVAPAICKDLPAVIASVPTFQAVGFRLLTLTRAYDFDRVVARP